MQASLLSDYSHHCLILDMMNSASDRALFKRDSMLYGHFGEHFHRQIYGGVFDPGSPPADEDGFRTDVLAVLQKIRTPIIRWPGGCFVSSYNWKKGVDPHRMPVFDKACRVEDPNTFATDEFIKLCRAMNNLHDLLVRGEIRLFDRGKFRWYESFLPSLHLYRQIKEGWMLDLARILRTQGQCYEKLTELRNHPLNK